jgi:hypothetical protein
MGPFGIGLKNVLIAIGAGVVASAVISLFRDDWTDSFLGSAPSIATGLLAVASIRSAQEGYAAGQRAAGQ